MWNTDIATTTGLLHTDDIINNRRLALFGHVVRLDSNTPAHQALKVCVSSRSGYQPDTRWRRAPGRPRQTHQIGDGTPLALRQQWKRALNRGHGGSSLRASAAYAS